MIGKASTGNASTGNSEIDPDYAIAIAARATKFMSQLSIPPTPNNFEIWFNYASGVPGNLKRAIEVLISNKHRFDASTNRDLFQTYVRSDIAGIASKQIQVVIESAKSVLQTAIVQNHAQIETLNEVSSRKIGIGDPERIIEHLIFQLSNAANRASELESSLAKASAEMEDIRGNLKQVEQRSNTDALTGLANRRALDEFLRTTQIAAMEHGTPLSVMLIDVDHFKKFNDNFGHQVGDQVLRLIARALQERLRDCDFPARFGGEELVVVLPKAALPACWEAAERIRRAISECKITRRASGETISSVTVSIGVAQFRPGETLESLIERCDQALYLAKRSGRNRTIPETELDRYMATG